MKIDNYCKFLDPAVIMIRKNNDFTIIPITVYECYSKPPVAYRYPVEEPEELIISIIDNDLSHHRIMNNLAKCTPEDLFNTRIQIPIHIGGMDHPILVIGKFSSMTSPIVDKTYTIYMRLVAILNLDKYETQG